MMATTDLDLDAFSARARAARKDPGDWAMDYGIDVPVLVAGLRAAEERLAAVATLLDARDVEHAEYVRQIEAGELITLDRFIGPPMVLVREVRAALGEAAQ